MAGRPGGGVILPCLPRLHPHCIACHDDPVGERAAALGAAELQILHWAIALAAVACKTV